MKKAKLFLSAIAVLGIVGGALAFKANSNFASGSVFCSSTCPAGQQVAYKIDPDGDFTAPCPGSVQPYVLDSNSGCVATPTGTNFSQTTDQGK
jgi:hypothetical protein